MKITLRHFAKLLDIYYWQTAILIAKNGLGRQYRNSFLGMLWTLLQPVAMITVYSLMMPKITNFKIPDYPLYVVVSLPLWTYFSGTFVYTSVSITYNAETLKRCMVSSTLFPVADVLRLTYMYFVSFLTMYILAVLLFAPFHPTILLMPLYFLPVLMIMGSAGIALAFLSPYLRDITEMVTLSMNMLYWLTPVIYPFSALPPTAQAWMKWNPFFIMMHPIQMLAYEGVLPGIDDMLRLLGLTVIAISVGFAIFKACRRNYVYYL